MIILNKMMKFTKACQKGKFEANLFDCSADYGICCYSTWCYPCALSYAWADVRDEDCTICHFYSFEIYIKSNIRKARGMRPDYCKDKRASTFCPFCSLTQDIREIQFIKNEIRASNQEPSNFINFDGSMIDETPLYPFNQVDIPNQNKKPPQTESLLATNTFL